MSKTKNFLKFLLNQWFCIFLCVISLSIAVVFLMTTPLKKSTNTFVLKQEIKTDSSKKIKQKISLNEGDYFSAGYSINTNDKEKTITTVGIICILPNRNILHVIVTGENIGDKIKNIEETIGFLTKHQNKIFDDIAITIVEASQKPPPQEPKKEKPSRLKNDKPIKKKV